jgi:uncharacterized phage protein (TIGR02220 family)
MRPYNKDYNSIDKKENNIKENSPPENQEHPSSVLRSTAKLVIDFLRMKTGRNYQYVDTTLKPIMQRLKEGITLDQCKQVIIRKHKEWGNNKEMEKYLRPSTLFNKSNFYDKYLPEIVSNEDKEKIKENINDDYDDDSLSLEYKMSSEEFNKIIEAIRFLVNELRNDGEWQP